MKMKFRKALATQIRDCMDACILGKPIQKYHNLTWVDCSLSDVNVRLLENYRAKPGLNKWRPWKGSESPLFFIIRDFNGGSQFVCHREGNNKYIVYGSDNYFRLTAKQLFDKYYRVLYASPGNNTDVRCGVQK